MANVSRVLSVVVAGVLGALGAFLVMRAQPQALPDTPALVLQMREVTRLETLDVSLYKKVVFSPEPKASDALWKDVVHWAAYSLRTPRGRAIVFADVHLGYEFQRIDASSLQVRGSQVEVVLPPVTVQVELRPGETEIIDSNLNSTETTQLLELARTAFEREARGDVRLKERARQSAERSLKALFLSLGFTEVHFVDTLTRTTAG
ncbi:DUF4230 domain-containing protein [Stigmatella sp. ncwal1]|uniref:DUF4230 domain-containing protein n=1 Tax=Stigmatella ashevillensis TaxID=2995309 RepID=A0ABT5DD24_9BACT|nr:DUF4230 domain-containing protein [Stigmatella ashevillena]MDC0710251.1 DUF4230 domain-containing protein [Stigmatella ashevillena]